MNIDEALLEQINIPQLWPNLHRAIEIAIYGNHSISIYTDKNEYPDSNMDYHLIRTWYGSRYDIEIYRVLPTFGDTDMKISVAKPRDYLKYFGETIDTDIKKTTKVTVSKQLNKTNHTLLANAVEKLGLNLTKTINVITLAATIAQFEGHDLIKPGHLAEAIGYSYVSDDYYTIM